MSDEENPFVTVVIRSHCRLASMIELVEKCQAQNYNNFEILVIEQSSKQRNEFLTRIEELNSDSRIRILYFSRLGPAAARNTAVTHANGDILIFIDDDDLPASVNWISAHVKTFEDPLCVATTGREIWEEGEDLSLQNNAKNYRLCLRYSFLKMPRARVRHTKRIRGVTALQGTNTSIRKRIIESVGGWDEDVEGHEENSFDFRFQRIRLPGEYYLFEPAAAIFRRFDIDGGLERRRSTTLTIFKGEIYYSHRILRRYFPVRFYVFYPAYIWLALSRTYEYMRSIQPKASRTKHFKEIFLALFGVSSNKAPISGGQR